MSEQPGPRWYTLDEMCERLGLDPDVIRARADALAGQALTSASGRALIESLEASVEDAKEGQRDSYKRGRAEGYAAGIEAAISTVERTAGLDLMVMDSTAWVNKAAVLRALRKMLPGGS